MEKIKMFFQNFKGLGIIILLMVIVFALWRVVSIYNKMTSQIKEAKEIILNLEIDNKKLGELANENKQLQARIVALTQKKDDLIKNYERLKKLNGDIRTDLKAISSPEIKNNRNVKALLSDLERHRNYTFQYDSIFNNED